jgi:hypothetical protein
MFFLVILANNSLSGRNVKGSLVEIANHFYNVNRQVENIVYSILGIMRNAENPALIVPNTNEPPKTPKIIPDISNQDVITAIKSMNEDLKTDISSIKFDFINLENTINNIVERMDKHEEEHKSSISQQTLNS